ncbi:Variable lymphocyte receptor C, partial [Operophtera brumata]
CAAAQSDDEFNIPVENDNQYPPDNHAESDGSIIEGSGLGAIEEPVDVTTQPNVPLVQDVQLQMAEEDEHIAPEPEDTSCPKPCVCHIEGDSSNFVVDCSGYELTEFPSPIDTKTTTLNIQNNKLTEIPKEVSALKNLKVLNANDNSIMDLALGSISELPELTTLKLGNNRIIEFPKDLKNSFGLTKLEELDLGGNDMRTPLTREAFSSFSALRKLTLPTATTDLVDDLCNALKSSLDTVCSESCSNQAYDCPDAPQPIADEDDLLKVILPGTIPLSSDTDEDTNINQENIDTTPANEESHDDGTPATPVSPNENGTDPSEFSLRSAVNKAESAGISPLSTLVVAPKETEDDHKESDVSVGATTSSTKTGGVDKSVIGLIVAGMVLVVAGITIKKNWSTIKNRFSSSPRPANDRTPNTNGTAPEEVPLQDNKSPV